MTLRRLSPADAEAYRALMLRAYADETAAFTSTVAERAPLPLDWWTARVSDRPDAEQLVIGACEADRLVGVVGLRFNARLATRHKALLFGMAVEPDCRGRGLGRALVEAALTHARTTSELQMVTLTVMAPNEAAQRLYAACGFVSFGTEPMAVRRGDAFVPLVHMACDLNAES